MKNPFLSLRKFWAPTSFLLSLLVLLLGGCRSGKSAASTHAISQADSIKYEAVRQAFLDGEFVFRISRIGGSEQVNSVDNFMVFHDGYGGYQELQDGQPVLEKAQLIKAKYVTNSKKGEIVFSGEISHAFTFKIYLYENSDRAYGYYGGILLEGWIEPYNAEKIATGYHAKRINPVYRF